MRLSIDVENDFVVFFKAETIIEALDIWREEKLKRAEHEVAKKSSGKEVFFRAEFLRKTNRFSWRILFQLPEPVPHFVLQALGNGYTAEKFVHKSLREISARFFFRKIFFSLFGSRIFVSVISNRLFFCSRSITFKTC